jgi:hypothetical protein
MSWVLSSKFPVMDDLQQNGIDADLEDIFWIKV